MKKFLLGLLLLLSVAVTNAASLAELNGLTGTPDWDVLVGKIRAALIIKAYDLTELASPTAEQLAFALAVLQNPGDKAREVVFYVVAANNTASVATIFGASDTIIKTNVNAAVDNLFAQ